MLKLSKKGLLGLLITLLFSLSGCRKDTLEILIPTGGPAYATSYLQTNSEYKTTVVSGSEALTAAFNDIGYDVIIAPVNLGAKLYNAKPNYPLVGVITWGNYYLISETSIDLSTINRLEVTAFGENQIPDFLIQFIFNQYQIEYDITYLDSVAAITSAYLLDSSKVYLIAEPSLSILETKQVVHKVDLQVHYQEITQMDGFPQAGVFVLKNVSSEKRLKLIRDLTSSIQQIKTSTDAYTQLKTVGIELPESIYQQAITNSHIEFKDAYASKAALIDLFERIYAFNQAFIGKLPDDSFYR
ncbi:hypothetical protein N7603_03320 [Acholeplasma vituli]|uniref:SsuA/THI5-like domain-containing protein n=1 Tax=Paracholeplasma vituli TaxID=69473 RepID=A0ABT2PUQ8_9MOLU|nr:hypothetical protein [Paracholeplasma vituli]MCU0104679.1 hypothetical protein [Paracholeplasma vituli]